MPGIRSGGKDQLSLCFILHRLKLPILLPYKLPTAAPRFLLLLITVPYGIVLGLFFLPQRDHGGVRATGEVNSRSFRLQRGCGSLSQHVSRRFTCWLYVHSALRVRTSFMVRSRVPCGNVDIGSSSGYRWNEGRNFPMQTTVMVTRPTSRRIEVEVRNSRWQRGKWDPSFR